MIRSSIDRKVRFGQSNGDSPPGARARGRLRGPQPDPWRLRSRRRRCAAFGAALLASVALVSALATPPAHAAGEDVADLATLPGLAAAGGGPDFAALLGGAATIERLEIGRTDIAVFLLNGPIVGDETIRLEREISRLPSQLPVAVVLNSPGGNLAEGIKLGMFFYAAKIPTFTMGFGGYCMSACSTAFLGGRDRVTGKPSRFKMVNSQLGFHQFAHVHTEEDKKKVYKKADIDAAERDARNTTFAIISYLKAIGEDMSKLHAMLKAPAESMTNLPDEWAVALGIHVMGEDANDFIEATRVSERIKAQYSETGI